MLREKRNGKDKVEDEREFEQGEKARWWKDEYVRESGGRYANIEAGQRIETNVAFAQTLSTTRLRYQRQLKIKKSWGF
jgi:hypothetical protein